MRLMKTAGAIVTGAILIGCQGGGGPKASAPAGSNLSTANEQTAAELQRTYRASHPGSQVGYVNAVDPGRRILSVAGIPPEMVRPGAIMTVLTDGGGTLQAVVYARAAGYVQLRYEPLGPGQSGPAAGELTVWNPGGPAIIPESIPPTTGAPTGNIGAPTTGPGTGAELQPAPPPPTVPTTVPMTDIQRPLTDTQPPTTRPAEIPPTTETPPPPPPISPPPATTPASRPATDLNK
jgi:hypothetical protein